MSKPICILQSPIWTRSGYGDWALAVAKSLLRYGKFDLHLAPTVWGACSRKNLEEEMNDPEGKELLNRVLKGNLTRQPEVFIQMTIPNEYSTPAKFNIGMTAGIETTVPKPEWIEGLNRMNVNFVTSQHAKDVFVGANYTKKNPNGTTEPLTIKSPMEVLFWGANTHIYKKTSDKVESLEKVMTFMSQTHFVFSSWVSGLRATFKQTEKPLDGSSRPSWRPLRGWIILPPSFSKQVEHNSASWTSIDCLNKINDVTGMVKQSLPNAKLPNVYLLHGELSDVEMNALYNHAKIKAHVSFTHGEGFGHPLLLATLSGKPVVTPHWSGHLDFLNPDLTTFFEGKIRTHPRRSR